MIKASEDPSVLLNKERRAELNNKGERKFTVLQANKNVVTDLHSKMKSWQDLQLPKELVEALEDLKMDKPSII